MHLLDKQEISKSSIPVKYHRELTLTLFLDHKDNTYCQDIPMYLL